VIFQEERLALRSVSLTLRREERARFTAILRVAAILPDKKAIRRVSVKHRYTIGLTSARRSGFFAGVFLAFYSICLVLLLPRLSLWLDEILDMIGVRFSDLPRLIEYVPTNSGGVPLGYLTQAASVHALGYSAFSGRLPSAIFSVLGALGILLIAKRFALRWPLLALAVFCFFPLQFRYALEARPYSQALAIAIWMTLAFLWLREGPNWRRSLLYCACIAAGLYTQPFSVFAAVAHFLWVILSPADETKRKLSLATGGALSLAALAFLPWYSYARQFWRESIQTSHFHSTLNVKTPLLILHELIGAGYPGSILLLLGVCVGLTMKFRSRPDRLFWILMLLCPVFFALLADQVFGYFVAIRQMIFLLAPLAILFAAGVEILTDRWPRLAALFTCVLAAILIYGNIHLFTMPREDWATAANLLADRTRQGQCVIFLPPDSARLYDFFNPQASSLVCPSDLATARTIIAAMSPYGSIAAQKELELHLFRMGFRRQVLLNNLVRVDLYQNRMN
jgi:hypothetical protein